MDKVKSITIIGIIMLLIICSIFSLILKDFVLKEAFAIPHDTHITPYTLQESSKVNAELIQKNIDFLKENLKKLQHMESQTQIELPLNIESKEIVQDSKLAHTDSTSCYRLKPQLAIIIDDIGTQAQYQAVLTVPYKLTPSFFPRSKAAPDTPRIAKNAPFYMVHLPLEALSFYQKEYDWLFVGDSKERIESMISTIKQDFPQVKYINNHAGSKFTQDLASMTSLLEILQDKAIQFVDSKTIATTKSAQAYAKISFTAQMPCQQIPLIRDVFLDNSLEISEITKQLVKAVEIAKAKGYAIAIAHPHQVTLLALKNAESYLKASGVELVYVNEIITP